MRSPGTAPPDMPRDRLTRSDTKSYRDRPGIPCTSDRDAPPGRSRGTRSSCPAAPGLLPGRPDRVSGLRPPASQAGRPMPANLVDMLGHALYISGERRVESGCRQWPAPGWTGSPRTFQSSGKGKPTKNANGVAAGFPIGPRGTVGGRPVPCSLPGTPHKSISEHIVTRKTSQPRLCRRSRGGGDGRAVPLRRTHSAN